MSRFGFAIRLLAVLVLKTSAVADVPSTAPAEPALPTFIYGIVTEADGVTPVKRLNLTALATDGRGGPIVGVASTSADGTFIFQPAMKPGPWSIRMLAGGVLGSVDLKPGIPVAVRLKLPTGSIHGTIFDPTGAPAAGVTVHLMDGKNLASYHATTDENGGYRIEHVSAGQYRFSAFIKLDTDPPAYQRVDDKKIDIGQGDQTKDGELMARPSRPPTTRPGKPNR